MTKDIWDEKPIRPSSETHLMFERRIYSWEYQLKIEYDKLKEKADKWDNMMEKSMEAPYIDCVGNAEKLEAVKSWHKVQIKACSDVEDIPRSGKLFRLALLVKNLEGLGEILEAEG